MQLSRAMATAALAFALVSCQQRTQGKDVQCECSCQCLSPAGGATAEASRTPSVPVAQAASSPADLPTQSDKVILIGHVGALSGDQASYGESTNKGIRLAIEEQNKKGGIKGKQIALKTLDDQGKAEQSAAAATRLISQDRVKLIIGPETSGRALAVGPICDASKVPMLSNTATNPKVTKEGDKTRPYVFRVCFIDPFQGTVMAKFGRDVLKVYQVGVLRNGGDEYSTGLANVFVNKFKELGGGIVTEQNYKTGDQDFKAQLAAIKSRGADAIYVPGYYNEVALIARQARAMGMTQPLMGGDGWDSPRLYEMAKGALDGSYFSNHYSDQDPSPVIQDFVRKYKTVYGTTPEAFAVLGYDATRVALDAMERAKDLSGPAIRDAIEQTKGFQAVSGTISLDDDHNAVKPSVVLNIDKNTAYYSATITP